MREKIEYWLVVAVARTLGACRAGWRGCWPACWPSPCTGASGGCAAWACATWNWPFRSSPPRTQSRILRGVYRHLGWQLVEFCRMTRYTPENTRGWMRTEGLDHYLAAQARGKGVLIVTGHLGAWELSSFYHSLMGYPMGMVIRRLDNRRLDEFVNGIRCLHGNRVLHKDDFARGLLTAMRQGETVGILMDTNMTPPQGVFVDFFGIQACTASGLARVALKTGAAVLPGFMVWEAAERRTCCTSARNWFSRGPATSRPTSWPPRSCAPSVIERWIRRYPDQWLWIHRRWKTRPAGEPGIY